jgi:hypothetical protein
MPFFTFEGIYWAALAQRKLAVRAACSLHRLIRSPYDRILRFPTFVLAAIIAVEIS